MPKNGRQPELYKRRRDCKFCGEKDLQWIMTPTGYRLGRGKKVHECGDAFYSGSSKKIKQKRQRTELEEEMC